jgi:hypothetical protein
VGARPHCPQPPTFVQLWNGLPAELKAQLLTFILRASAAHDGISCDRCIASFTAPFFRRTLLEPLSQNAVGAGALLQVKLTTTSILFGYLLRVTLILPKYTCFVSEDESVVRIAYTHRLVNVHIRTIEVGLFLGPLEWKFLARLASGEYGIDNLEHVTISFKWSIPY